MAWQTGRGVSRQPALQGLRELHVRERHAMDRNEDRKRRKEDEMSEEKCPFCEGTTSVAYYHTGNNLLYCKDCKRTFSERDAKIMKQAARIAELEKELEQMRTVALSYCELARRLQESLDESNRYWDKALVEARKLTESSKGD